MILYTVLPLEVVLEGIDKERTFMDVEIRGVTMTVEQLSPNEAAIVRIISTDPQHFLDPALQPGTRIRLAPTLSTSSGCTGILPQDQQRPSLL
ncbi:MAG: YlzJ-like family protein [Clostridia bacterium]